MVEILELLRSNQTTVSTAESSVGKNGIYRRELSR
jgi:hypothetical protein